MKINSVHISIEKKKQIAFCSELPSGILLFNSYLDIKSMNINSPDVNINEYKLLCVNTLNFSYSFEKLGILHYLGFSKHLREIDLDFIDTYHELEI